MALLLVPGLVLGHAELDTPTPADSPTVTEPVTEVSGIFSEAMKVGRQQPVVKDFERDDRRRGRSRSDRTTSVMFAIPATPLGSGQYTVEWTTNSRPRRHVATRIWRFTVAVAPTPSPSPVVTAAPSATPAPSASATPTPIPATPVPSAAPSPPLGRRQLGWERSDVILPIIVALIVLGAGAAYLLTRRNRPADQA